MKLAKQNEQAVMQVYDTWLQSYLSGDVKTYDSFLDDNYHFIGSTDNEEFLNRKDTTNFFETTADQLAGKTEIRNDTKTVEQFGELVFITHVFDGWFLNETEWVYYGRFRFTSALRKNKNGWRFVYQHFSTTDSKAQEGETLGTEQITKENLELRDAIKRRTVELEQKTRELEIEAALEKVRSRSIDMRKTSELEEVILMVNEQFKKLKVNITGGAFIVIHEKLKEGFYCWGAGGAGDYVQEVFIPPLDRPISTTIGENIKKGTKFFTEHYCNAEKKEFFQHLFKYPPFSETPPERKKELLELPDGYARSCAVSEQTSIFIINHHGKAFTEDENNILRQMGRVFEQAYTRFLDLKKASDQAQQISEERDRLEIALNELHATQAQLIQQEKLASLGQLTAGIAHEIKNPLNFVNNFSELSVELIEETFVELKAVSDQLSADDREKVDEALGILTDIEMNLRKIHEHGSRADSIVKSMLEHSRGGTGKLEPTHLNALINEFVNLSFHGMRAGKNPINVDLNYELDENIGEVPLIAEDFSRVIINLCNNAFDAMRDKLSVISDQHSASYKPKLTIRTKSENGKIVLEIEDNGSGIPEEMKDKILQPFFTTKKGTEGTGLGLSITNDIVKAHGGELSVTSKKNEGTKFSIQLRRD